LHVLQVLLLLLQLCLSPLLLLLLLQIVSEEDGRASLRIVQGAVRLEWRPLRLQLSWLLQLLHRLLLQLRITPRPTGRLLLLVDEADVRLVLRRLTHPTVGLMIHLSIHGRGALRTDRGLLMLTRPAVVINHSYVVLSRSFKHAT
ncbi:hypothetical protein PFISCL1PPCAC_9003, partial [Pristionchus fissidentatus]